MIYISEISIVGTNGQLGTELQRQLKEKNIDFFAVDLPDFDITNLQKVIKKISEVNSNIIINCAANTNVDGCENNKDSAFKVNAMGPRNLAIAANKINSKLVHVSTDYVFSGKGKTSYKEYDKPNPNTVYGQSKLMGEQFVEKLSNKYYIIRTAWLYGKGENFVRTILKLGKEKDELDVVNDQIGSPTSTVDLAKSILELIKTEQYGLYHGTCEGECSWYEFAKKIFELSNINVKVNPVCSEEFKRLATRPAYSVLDNYMLKLIGLNTFRKWEDALEEYLEMEV